MKSLKNRGDIPKYVRPANVDDFNLVKYCSQCKKRVDEILPEKCPHCEHEFESTADRFFKRSAIAMVIVAGIYLWQKVILGIL